MGTTRLTTQAAIIGAGRLLNMAAAASTLMVLARIMPNKESYGAVCQLIMLYMVLSQIFAVGLPQSTFYFLPRYQGGERRGFLIQTVLLLMLSGVVLGCLLYTGAAGVGRLLGSPLLGDLLRVFAIYPIFMLPTLAVEGTLLHANRPAAVVIFNASVRVGMFCALVIPIFYHATLVQAITVWMVEAGVMWGIALALMFSTVRGVRAAWKREMLHDEWGFSLPLAAVTLIAISSNYVDRFLVSHAFGSAMFGVYTNGTIEIPTVTMVTNATAVVLMAEFSRRTSVGDFDGVLPIWHRAMVKMGVLIFASLGFLAFWGHETMQILFSNRFADSGTIFSIYVWIVPLLLFAMQPLYVSIGATRVLIAVTAFDLCVGTACVLFFGHYFGMIGMAFGAIFSKYIGTSLWVHWYVRWITKIGWVAFMPWKKIATILVTAVLAGGMSRLLHFWLTPTLPMLAEYVVAILVYLPLYAIGLYFTHLLDAVVPARFLPARGMTRKEVTV
ncbi:MAG TPA: hypothetical protein VGL77_11120 [Armatimonadota bacterium]|jgi:O-antigen/teichoic acid export membrane protein